MMRAFVTQPVGLTAIERLRRVIDVDVNPDGSRILPKSELMRAVQRHEILFCLLHDRVDAEVLGAGAKLKLVASMAITPDAIDVAEATRRGIPVTVIPPVVTEATADICFGLMLAVARRMLEADRLVRAGGYPGGQSNHLAGAAVSGKTLGLVGGKGRIGQAVARRARGFDMRILYTDEIPRPEIEAATGARRVDLETMLRESDFVTLHVPLTPETRGLVGAAQLAMMKPDAVLINTSRGPVVDQRALAEALKQGRPGMAALDVTDPEPIAMDDPLLALPNVIIAPHIASGSRATREQMAEMAVDNLLAALRGELPPNCVNPEALQRR